MPRASPLLCFGPREDRGNRGKGNRYGDTGELTVNCPRVGASWHSAAPGHFSSSSSSPFPFSNSTPLPARSKRMIYQVSKSKGHAQMSRPVQLAGHSLSRHLDSEGRPCAIICAKKIPPAIPPIFAVWPRFPLLDSAGFLPVFTLFPRFP